MSSTAESCSGNGPSEAPRSAAKPPAARGLVGPAAMALLALLASCVAAARSAPPDLLDAAVQASWTCVPLRDWAERATRLAGRPVIVDRRVDPTTLVTLDCRGEVFRHVLARVAEIAGADIDVLESTIRIVPRSAAGMAGSAESLREAAVARLPAAVRRKVTAREPWAWGTAARPRDLVADAARKADVTLVGIETIPHDHFPAAELPPLSLAERLDLVLAHYDRRVEWRAAGGSVVPMDDGVASPPRPQPADASPAPRGTKKTVVVRDVFSLRVEAPFDQALAAIAGRLGLDVDLDRASLAARGIAPGEIVRVDVQDASRNGLLDAVVLPLGLSWTIDDARLRVFAAPAAGPDGNPDEAAK